jgi:PEP-CTERM motif
VDAFGNLTLGLGTTSAPSYYALEANLGIDQSTPGAGTFFGSGFGGTKTLVYENDFSQNADGFSQQTLENGTLGRFSNDAVTLGLGSLIPGEEYGISFDLTTAGTWDGNNPIVGPDHWSLSADGATLLDLTPFNADHFRYGTDLSGRTFTGNTIMFRPTSSSALLTFAGSGLQGLNDEWWTLDNVQVLGPTRNNRIPEPGALLLLGAGVLAGVLGKRRR